ncbi:bifunctional hydroxymethylpyrimidine kinase/phosphomethylpyrimidine kinase [Rothia sp. CCM 9418]|uniref:bifunctional hydroxymethylpyrimidine kinase/phosphomethylpyrimidine kinase n=1 Tax=Rothia sp. CCM 9418 TaxID=3402661 RepID=UPI003AEC6991
MGDTLTSHSLSTQKREYPRVLTIAGSDSGGGAGIQADLKSIAAHGGYGMSAITALTAQNTRGVQQAFFPPAQFLSEQLEAISADIDIDAVKIGMLGTSEVITAVRSWLQKYRPPIVVLDPVMVATSGDSLAEEESVSELSSLFSYADVITPNAHEMAVLLGEDATEQWEVLCSQGQRLADRHEVAVLVKGGHCSGEWTSDALMMPGHSEPVWVGYAERVQVRTTHGTGCSFSAALATELARTGCWQTALERVKRWITGAIKNGEKLDVGGGNGPIDHFYHVHSVISEQSARLSDLDRYLLHAQEVDMVRLRESFSEYVWELSTSIREQVNSCPFVEGLGNGSLSQDAFIYYLDQDGLYLKEYSRALGQVGIAASDTESRMFFAHGAVEAVEVESELHRRWVSRFSDSAYVTGIPSATTEAYTDFLLARTGESYGVGAAAVLPCYWLYAEIGKNLYTAYQEYEGKHPYGEWLEAYSSEEFQTSAQQAVKFVNKIARIVPDYELICMKNAFLRACWLELRFFEEPISACHLPLRG